MTQKPVLMKPYGTAEREKAMFSDVAEVRNARFGSEEEFAAAMRDVTVLIADVDIQVTRRILEGAPNLRGIMACSIGVDYIDLQAATDRGVYVANLPDYCTNAVAEYAVGMMFTLARHIARGAQCVQADHWDGRRLLKGMELFGKRLGLIGFGRIGQFVGRKAVGLGMKVSYFDPMVSGPSPVPACQPSASLNDLLDSSDVVSIHAPLTKGTRGLISYAELARMKPTALLINVSRGGIVHEGDLERAVREGRIAGAALDVLEVEPMQGAHPLLGFDNVLITPHMAWNTFEAKENAEDSIVEQVRQMLEGKKPTHLVNREVVSRPITQ